MKSNADRQAYIDDLDSISFIHQLSTPERRPQRSALYSAYTVAR